jgi:hypothetical protein
MNPKDISKCLLAQAAGISEHPEIATNDVLQVLWGHLMTQAGLKRNRIVRVDARISRTDRSVATARRSL